MGSAAVGISLNPNKAFKTFDLKSDIDVAVISSFHFQSAWRFLRQNGKLRPKLSSKERNAWDEHRRNLVFNGAIATDRLLARFPFGGEWRRAIDEVEAASSLTQSVKVRVYNDYEALNTYQTNSVRQRRTDLLSQGAV